MKQVTEIAKTCARVFCATLLAAVVAAGVGVLEWDTWGDWKPVIAAAGIAVAVVILNAVNPADDRYGLNAKGS